MARSPRGAWEDAPEAWHSWLTGVAVRASGVAAPEDVLDVRAIPPGTAEHPLPAERRWKLGCVSRTAAAVAPVGRPEEALATVLGDDRDRDDSLHG